MSEYEQCTYIVGKFAKDEKETEGSGERLEGWSFEGAGSDK